MSLKTDFPTTISPIKCRETLLPFSKPDITEQEIEAVNRVLRSGWLTSGPQVVEFEKEFANAVDCKHAIAVNSATAALHLGTIIWDMGPKDAVIVPSITFTATAEIITYAGGYPLILDVNRDTYLLDPEIVRSYILKNCTIKNKIAYDNKTGRRIKGMIPVHLGGRPCQMDEIRQLAEEFQIQIMEDAAHSFPARYKDRPIGSISDLTAFSFYATKNLATGEGGMLTTNNDLIAERVRIMRLHGIKGQTYGRKRWNYDVVDTGYKYNMMDLCAAMGRVQLQRSDEMLKKRKEISEYYASSLKNLPGIHIASPLEEGNSFHLFTIEIEPEPGRNRDWLVEELYNRNIASSLHFIPLYRLSHYKNNYRLNKSDYPNSEDIYDRIVSLPLCSAMTMEDAADVVNAIQNILE